MAHRTREARRAYKQLRHASGLCNRCGRPWHGQQWECLKCRALLANRRQERKTRRQPNENDQDFHATQA